MLDCIQATGDYCVFVLFSRSWLNHLPTDTLKTHAYKHMHAIEDEEEKKK